MGVLKKKMEWGMPIDFPLVWEKLWCTYFVQVLDMVLLQA